MADGCQSLPSEAMGRYAPEIREGFQLASGEPLTHYPQIILSNPMT